MRAELADRVAVADHERGRLAGVLLVLRRRRRSSRTGRCGCRGRSSCGPRSRSAARPSCRRRCARPRRRCRRHRSRPTSCELGPGLDDGRRVDRRHRDAAQLDAGAPCRSAALRPRARRRPSARARELEDAATSCGRASTSSIELVARLDRALEAGARRCRRSSRSGSRRARRRRRRTTSSAAACASASIIITPGMTGRCGKWPRK